MKKAVLYLCFVLSLIVLPSCSNQSQNSDNMETKKIIFLHHSTGSRIWKGDNSSFISKIKAKLTKSSAVGEWFNNYNKTNNVNYIIEEQAFPKKTPYGWHNYPYDYYNVWVKNAGDRPYMEEPTLEILAKDNDVIIWKHCYPVSDILEDTGNPDINSSEKRIENYKLQYNALKKKMHQFPDKKFIVWTGAALLETKTTKDNANRAKVFFDWIVKEWDETDDNIHIWDFRDLETDGSIFMNPQYASGEKDNHPNHRFSESAFSLFCNRIVDVIETNGEKTSIKGEKL